MAGRAAGQRKGTPPLAPTSPAAIASCDSHPRSPPGRASPRPRSVPTVPPRRPGPPSRTGGWSGRRGPRQRGGTGGKGRERETEGQGIGTLRAGWMAEIEGVSSPPGGAGEKDGGGQLLSRWDGREGRRGSAPLRAGRGASPAPA